ncbi:MAG: beta-ketoacyl synthase chain length factor [Clostridiales bacterium]|nr:beta-ketoacyl synthase chain length factor [Clostridiales bacterium]
MKCARPIYVIAAQHISLQHPLSEEWLQSPLLPQGAYNKAIDPDFKKWLSPLEARRLGVIMKRAVATSLEAMEQCGVKCPDAIITATGLGCVKNTELFLTDLCTNGENLLKPTQFMQSTHNTIGSLIAILTKNHGYNVTYANGDISFETAMLDAMTQLNIGDIGTVLVGAHDEMTPCYYTLLERIGYYGAKGMVSSGETAVSLLLSTDHEPDETPCRIESIDVIYNATTERIHKVIGNLGKIDAFMLGINGNDAYDAKYQSIVERVLQGSLLLKYKNLFGESMTSSALGLYASVNILNKNKYPDEMYISGPRYETLDSIALLNISSNHLAIIKVTK